VVGASFPQRTETVLAILAQGAHQPRGWAPMNCSTRKCRFDAPATIEPNAQRP
jgi:hypothetical protein